MRCLTVIMIVVTLFLAGCSPAAQPSTLTEPSISPTIPLVTSAPPAAQAETPQVTLPPTLFFEELPMSKTPEVPPSDLPVPAAPESILQLAQKDLSSRLGVDPQAIELVGYEEVVWPDGSLGCPQPDMAYTQVQRDGYRMTLSYQGVLYDYHGGGTRPPFLCEEGTEKLGPNPGFGDS